MLQQKTGGTLKTRKKKKKKRRSKNIPVRRSATFLAKGLLSASF